MRSWLVGTLVVALGAGCSSAESCPEGVTLGDAEMGCQCGSETVDVLPGCGEVQCVDGELELLGTGGGDSAEDTAAVGCG